MRVCAGFNVKFDAINKGWLWTSDPGRYANVSKVTASFARAAHPKSQRTANDSSIDMGTLRLYYLVVETLSSTKANDRHRVNAASVAVI